MIVKLKIESKNDWLKLYYDLWKCGLLRDLHLQDVNLAESLFPLEIPVDISNLVNLLSNPIAKLYKQKIDTALHESLVKVIG